MQVDKFLSVLRRVSGPGNELPGVTFDAGGLCSALGKQHFACF